MKRKNKITVIIIFIIIALLGARLTYTNISKEYKIKKYFNIQMPSGCEVVSYEKEEEEIKAVIKTNELGMKKILENIKKNKKRDYEKSKEYSLLKKEFGVEKEKVIKMYEGYLSIDKIYSTVKYWDLKVGFVKSNEEEYNIYFFGEIVY